MRAILVLLLLLLAPLAAAQSAGGSGSAGGSADACTSDNANRDRDEDGLPDAWECRHFKNLKQDAKGDPDEDGFSNMAEWEAGTDPTKASSHPKRDDPGSGSSGKPDDRDDDDESKDSETDESEVNETDEPKENRLARECGRSDDRNECVADYCADNEGDRACKHIVAKACASGKIKCAALIEPCTRVAIDDLDDDRITAVCKQLRKVDDIRVDAKHVDFDVDREGRALINYSVSGTTLLAAIQYGEEHEDFEVKKDGARIRFKTDESRLEIHDNPMANFWYRTDDEDATLRLVLTDGATIQPAPNGLNIGINGYNYRLAGKALDVDGLNVTLSGDARFFRTGQDLAGANGIVDEAKAAGKVGAAVELDDDIEVTAYDDVAVNVTKPQKITTETPLRVVVNATLDEGRTIIIDIDRKDLAGPELSLSYYDLNDDGTETEVVFRMADSLEDVMDASNDGGQPEYWIVEDDDGIHVMASVPHWSTHIIQVAAEFLTQPSVLIGIAAGVLGVGIGGAGMFWPRRREEF